VLASVFALGFLILCAPGAIAQSEQDLNKPVELNFEDADIDTVVGAFGYLLDRTFIIDPRVRGKITVQTPQPVSRNRAFQMLQSALRLQGFTIVASGGRIAKVVPEADAKLQSGPVNVGRNPPEGGDQIVTQVFKLNYESATNLVPVLRPLIAPNNTISAYPNNNSLVITDYATNLQRIARIIGTLDSPTTRQVIVLQVRHGIASDLAVMLTRLLDDTQRAGQGAQVDAGQRVVVIADPNSNSIMLRAASPAKVNLAKQLLTQLDRPTKNPGNIRVVYLRNANAAKLAQTLQAVLSGNSSGSSASTIRNRTNNATNALTRNNRNGANNRGARTATNSASSQNAITVTGGGATIAADPTTNSLIITAPDAVYRNLRTVIDKLDTRRAQVYIESLIVEVSAQKAAEFGIQWQFLDVQDGSARAIGGTNFTNLDGGGSILQATQNIATAGGGINLGVVTGTTTIPGIDGEILNLPLLARALESDAGANILATPNLLTMDNEEARIVIGQNVPFVTGQFTNTGAANASVNPFQTIERKDVGTTLRVRPQVSESGTVKLEIFQEVSSVQASAVASDIITNRRAIETNVLVDNGQIVVLGGLIEERIEGGESKVPVLGDIPVLGNLFRYDSRRRTKTNLLVFLRPVIVRDAQAAYGVTSSRYDFMRQIRKDSALPKHWLLPDMAPSQLTPLPPPPKLSDPNAPVDRETPAQKPAFDLRDSGSLAPDLQRHVDQHGFQGKDKQVIPGSQPVMRSKPAPVMRNKELGRPLNLSSEVRIGRPNKQVVPAVVNKAPVAPVVSQPVPARSLPASEPKDLVDYDELY
jgi:general secretion pathway protein D